MSSPGESSLSQTALTAAIGGTFAYYIYLSLLQTAREITPRSIGGPVVNTTTSSSAGGASSSSSSDGAILSLINFETEDAVFLSLILPSWTGVIQGAEIADVVIYPDDQVSSDLQQVKSEARQGYHTILAANGVNGSRPATLAMKTVVEIAGNTTVDVLLSPIELAKKAAGKLMEVTTIIALCTGPEDSDVDIFQKTVHGKVCSDVTFLENLAAIRKSCTKIDPDSTSPSAGFFSASNFLTLEDLFEPDTDLNAGALLDDRQDEWYSKVFSKYYKKNTSSKKDEDGEETFLENWRKAKLRAELLKYSSSDNNDHNNTNSQSLVSSLLVTPWKYRAFIELAHFVMYGQNERKFGSFFSGFGRGLVHGAQALRRFFSFSSTGSISESLKKVTATSVSGSGNNNDTTTTLPTEGSFSQLCNSDFGYSSEYPLCGRFEVHITVKMDGGEESALRFKEFASRIGLKIVQIELPVGEFPTQLMTSFYMQGTVERCTSGAWDLAAQIFFITGLEVQRVKLELQVHDIRNATALMNFNNNGESSASTSSSAIIRPFLLLNGPGLGLCPVRDYEAQNRRFMTPTQYFEFHLKLKIPGEIRDGVLKKVKEVCNKYDAHLSKNAFKPSTATTSSSAASASPSSPSSPTSASSADSCSLETKEDEETKTTTSHTYFYFVTLRLHDMGLTTSLERLDTLKKALEDVLNQNAFVVVGNNNNNDDDDSSVVKPVIHSIQREFAVFDSSAALDKGWIDMRTSSTNMHMF